jgi:hypothetical protein
MNEKRLISKHIFKEFQNTVKTSSMLLEILKKYKTGQIQMI